MQNRGNETVMRTINEDYDMKVWTIFSILNLQFDASDIAGHSKYPGAAFTIVVDAQNRPAKTVIGIPLHVWTRTKDPVQH